MRGGAEQRHWGIPGNRRVCIWGAINNKGFSLFLHLTFSMPRLFSFKAQGRKDFLNVSKHCHVGIA